VTKFLLFIRVVTASHHGHIVENCARERAYRGNAKWAEPGVKAHLQADNSFV
jgi:hypothetical protein